MSKRITCTLLSAALLLAGCGGKDDKPAVTTAPAPEKGAYKLPHCDQPIGTAALIEDAIPGLAQAGLNSPVPLLRLMLAQSNCFQVVDRGPAMARIQQERALAAGGALKSGSHMSGGQIVAADYLITPNVLFSDKDSGGGALAGIVPGGAALSGIVGGLNLKKLRANTILSLTDTRSGLQLGIATGEAKKTDLGFAAGGLGDLVGGGLGLYESTDLGKIVALSFVDAYSRLVAQAQKLEKPKPAAEEHKAPPPAAPKPSGPFVTTIAIALHEGPAWDSPEITKLPAGTPVTPTGGEDKDWWVVKADGRIGWLPSVVLKPAENTPAEAAAAPAAPAMPAAPPAPATPPTGEATPEPIPAPAPAPAEQH